MTDQEYIDRLLKVFAAVSCNLYVWELEDEQLRWYFKTFDFPDREARLLRIVEAYGAKEREDEDDR